VRPSSGEKSYTADVGIKRSACHTDYVIISKELTFAAHVWHITRITERFYFDDRHTTLLLSVSRQGPPHCFRCQPQSSRSFGPVSPNYSSTYPIDCFWYFPDGLVYLTRSVWSATHLHTNQLAELIRSARSLYRVLCGTTSSSLSSFFPIDVRWMRLF
jgi:hypothetical protein